MLALGSFALALPHSLRSFAHTLVLALHALDVALARAELFPSSRSTSLKLPRALMKVSRNSSCSAERRWKRPSPNDPSMRVPHAPHSRRVTVSPSAQIGHFAITGFSMRSKMLVGLIKCQAKLSDV